VHQALESQLTHCHVSCIIPTNQTEKKGNSPDGAIWSSYVMGYEGRELLMTQVARGLGWTLNHIDSNHTC